MAAAAACAQAVARGATLVSASRRRRFERLLLPHGKSCFLRECRIPVPSRSKWRPAIPSSLCPIPRLPVPNLVNTASKLKSKNDTLCTAGGGSACADAVNYCGGRNIFSSHELFTCRPRSWSCETQTAERIICETEEPHCLLQCHNLCCVRCNQFPVAMLALVCNMPVSISFGPYARGHQAVRVCSYMSAGALAGEAVTGVAGFAVPW